MEIIHSNSFSVCSVPMDACERDIITRVIELRRRFQISRRNLAEAIDISENELQQYEEYKAPLPASLLALIALALGVKTDYFFLETEEHHLPARE